MCASCLAFIQVKGQRRCVPYVLRRCTQRDEQEAARACRTKCEPNKSRADHCSSPDPDQPRIQVVTVQSRAASKEAGHTCSACSSGRITAQHRDCCCCSCSGTTARAQSTFCTHLNRGRACTMKGRCKSTQNLAWQSVATSNASNRAGVCPARGEGNLHAWHVRACKSLHAVLFPFNVRFAASSFAR